MKTILEMMQSGELKWKNLGARDKMQIVNGTALIASAIILYFLSFIVTLTIGAGVISAGGALLATGLAFFGVTAYVNNQMMTFESHMEERLRRLDSRTKKLEKDDDAEEDI